MKTVELNCGEALTLAAEFPFALICSFGNVHLGRTPSVLMPEEWLEARFFNGKQELRFFTDDLASRFVLLIAEEDDVCLYETAEIGNAKFGASVTFCRTMEQDEDGQYRIAYTRLTDWKEA